MKRHPDLPSVENAPVELLTSGHLWIEEKVDGAPFRFALRDSGVLAFGDENRVYDPTDVPPAYEYVVRHVRESFDREVLTDGTDRPEEIVFFGAAMHRRGVNYDWRRTPPFLGFDIWSGARSRFLPPDVVERAYERLGLSPINVFQKEVDAAYFDVESYEVPQSRWYDGPAAGVVLKNKTEGRAQLPNSNVPGHELPVYDGDSLADLVAPYLSTELVADVVAELKGRSEQVTFDAVYRRVLALATRELHPIVFGDDTVDPRAFRTAVAEGCREYYPGQVD